MCCNRAAKAGEPAYDMMTYVETGARFKCCRLIGQLHPRRANRDKRKQAATGSVDGEYLKVQITDWRHESHFFIFIYPLIFLTKLIKDILNLINLQFIISFYEKCGNDSSSKSGNIFCPQNV